MSVQQLTSQPPSGLGGMRSLEFADPGWSIGVQDHPLLKAHKQLPRKRIHASNTVNLRSQFHGSAAQPSNGSLRSKTSASESRSRSVSTTSELPPTPPSPQEPSDFGLDDSSIAETAILRSALITPIHQRSPPTPDITPPPLESAWWNRPFLGSQLSMTSTRADSFKTAREEISSDDEKEETFHHAQYPLHQKYLQSSHPIRIDNFAPRPSPLAQPNDLTPPHDSGSSSLSKAESDTTNDSIESEEESQNLEQESSTPPTSEIEDLEGRGPEVGVNAGEDVAENSKETRQTHGVPATVKLSDPSPPPSPSSAGVEMPILQVSKSLRRGQSLRDRVEESKLVLTSPSTEQFAHEIGWSFHMDSPDLKNRVNSWRLSGISATSTVEAIVVDTAPRTEHTLRHRGKNASLRSATSPLPNSKRNSSLSSPESVHRLIHKTGKLSNQNRWSIGSDASRSLSVSSSIAPQPKPEIIHVAVIPERKSSLRSSTTSSNRRSLSLSMSSSNHKFAEPIVVRDDFPEPPIQMKRTRSDSLPSGASFASRGRERGNSLLVPPRSSSVSASTTQSNSRTNSITSENVRMRRLTAEADLHQTLARMESERSVRTVRIGKHHVRPRDEPPTLLIDPEPDQWVNLRPPSTHNTPFSQPSVQSASPDPVEMGEARAVNIFPHNNRSLQLIERHSMPDPREVEMLRATDIDLDHAVSEPRRSADVRQDLVIDSPLRNPRRPPQPPKVAIIPPTPADSTPVGEENNVQLGGSSDGKGAFVRRFGSLKRPSIKARPYSESFVKSFSRSMSLKNARNKKANQNLDRNLHPFWRPRGFWDDFSESDSDDNSREEDIIVNNSLGMPQKRIIFNGPLSLVRRISDGPRRRKQDHGITKQSSSGSLSKIRAARKVRKVPGLGFSFQLVSLRDIQRRVSTIKQKKDNERRERRRENLRKSIGPTIFPTGDSLFPAAMSATVPAESSLVGTTVVEPVETSSSSSSGTETGPVGEVSWLYASV